MHRRMLGMMLAASAGGGGGGGGGGSGATPWDDNFDYAGPSIDTAGTRFSGAQPWTLFNASSGLPLDSSLTVGSNLLRINSGSYSFTNPRGAYMGGVTGNFRFRAKWTTIDNNSSNPFHGMFIREAATGKFLLGGVTNVFLQVARFSNTTTVVGTYPGGSPSSPVSTFWAEFERSGSALSFRITENATDGNDLTTALGSTDVLGALAQTTDFTVGPDQIGLAVNGDTQDSDYDWIVRLV